MAAGARVANVAPRIIATNQITIAGTKMRYGNATFKKRLPTPALIAAVRSTTGAAATRQLAIAMNTPSESTSLRTVTTALRDRDHPVDWAHILRLDRLIGKRLRDRLADGDTRLPEQMGRTCLRLARQAVTALLNESASRSKDTGQTEAGLA